MRNVVRISAILQEVLAADGERNYTHNFIPLDQLEALQAFLNLGRRFQLEPVQTGTTITQAVDLDIDNAEILLPEGCFPGDGLHDRLRHLRQVGGGSAFEVDPLELLGDLRTVDVVSLVLAVDADSLEDHLLDLLRDVIGRNADLTLAYATWHPWPARGIVPVHLVEPEPESAVSGHARDRCW